MPKRTNMSRSGAPTCGHPDRKIKARGLCHSCYKKQFADKNRASQRAWWAKRRAEDPEWVRARARAYYAAHPERAKAYARRYNDLHRDELRAKAKVAHKRRKYGLTPEQFQAMFDSQNGLCALCGFPFEAIAAPRKHARGVFPHVDHDHTTGAVRALLCGSCNRGLGAFRDDPVTLELAIEYLRRYESG